MDKDLEKCRDKEIEKDKLCTGAGTGTEKGTEAWKGAETRGD